MKDTMRPKTPKEYKQIRKMKHIKIFFTLVTMAALFTVSAVGHGGFLNSKLRARFSNGSKVRYQSDIASHYAAKHTQAVNRPSMQFTNRPQSLDRFTVGQSLLKYKAKQPPVQSKRHVIDPSSVHLQLPTTYTENMSKYNYYCMAKNKLNPLTRTYHA